MCVAIGGWYLTSVLVGVVTMLSVWMVSVSVMVKMVSTYSRHFFIILIPHVLEYVALFGRCISNSTAFLEQGSSNLKYRKPTAPPIPDECYTEVTRGNKKETILDPSQAHMPGCQRITYPDEFDETSLECGRSDHKQCQESDTNMFCTTEGRCVCRQDMAFNRG